MSYSAQSCLGYKTPVEASFPQEVIVNKMIAAKKHHIFFVDRIVHLLQEISISSMSYLGLPPFFPLFKVFCVKK